MGVVRAMVVGVVVSLLACAAPVSDGAITVGTSAQGRCEQHPDMRKIGIDATTEACILACPDTVTTCGIRWSCACALSCGHPSLACPADGGAP